MKTTVSKDNKLIDGLKEFANLKTDIELAKILKRTPGEISNIRTGRIKKPYSLMWAAATTLNMPVHDIEKLM